MSRLALTLLLPLLANAWVAPGIAHGRRLQPVRMAAVTDTKGAISDAESRMQKSVDSLESSYGAIRTGRANPAMLKRVMVDYYGTETPLNQMAGISTQGSQQLVIDVYDKGAMAEVEKALVDSDLGMMPQNDGSVIRLNVPQLTSERRKEYSKQAKAMGEEAKVAVRNIRRDANEAVKKMEKAKDGISEDESKNAQTDIQAATDTKIKAIDAIVKAKEAEIMKV